MVKQPESASAKAPAKKTPKRGRSAVGAHSKAKPRKARANAKPKAKGKAKPKPGKEPSGPAEAKPASDARKTRATPPPPPEHYPRATDIEWTEAFVEGLAQRFWEYILATPYPTIAEFCFNERIHRQRLYEKPVLDYLREFLACKKENYLERQLLYVTRDDGSRTTGLIFALKQLGWRDQPEDAGPGNDAINKRRSKFDELFGESGAPVQA